LRVIAVVIWSDQLQWNVTAEGIKLTLSEQDDSVDDDRPLNQWSMLEPTNYIDFLHKLMDGFRSYPKVETLEVVNAIISVQNAFVNVLTKETDSVDVS
jgi:hypothetical protein